MNEPSALALRLKEARERGGYSRSAAAQKMGVSSSSVRDWEEGRKPIKNNRSIEVVGQFVEDVLGRDPLVLRLKEARKTLGYSQSEAAKTMGVSVNTLRHWEQGQYPITRTRFISIVEQFIDEVNRGVHAPKPQERPWAQKYPNGCRECGRKDRRHVGHGLCTACFSRDVYYVKRGTKRATAAAAD